jgi:hypothetical protein
LKEENVMLLDNDFYLYKKGLIKKAFDHLKDDKKVVSMFDGSGGMSEVIWERFPYLKGKYLRLSPPCIFAKRKLLLNMSFDPMYYQAGTFIPDLDYTTKEGDWLDAFGEAMVKVLREVKEDEIEFIPNDFSSLLLHDDGRILEDKREEYGCGYYHLRNSSLGFCLANERLKDKSPNSSYRQRLGITPGIEGLRLLAWAWLIGERDENFKRAIMGVVEDYGVLAEKWAEYIEKFKDFHSWTREIE